jgi:arylsulfatase
MIVSWKGKIKPNTMTDAVGHLVDLMPTFLDICSVKYPSEYNGNSILPSEGESLKDVLLGNKPGRERELGWYLYGSRAYRIGKWKLVWGVTARKWELYDMEADRTETHDLAAANAGIVRNLSEAWLRWARRGDVPLKT